jgi:hypothetical protein
MVMALMFFFICWLFDGVSLHLRQLDFERKTRIVSFRFQLVVQNDIQLFRLLQVDFRNRKIMEPFAYQRFDTRHLLQGFEHLRDVRVLHGIRNLLGIRGFQVPHDQLTAGCENDLV